MSGIFWSMDEFRVAGPRLMVVALVMQLPILRSHLLMAQPVVRIPSRSPLCVYCVCEWALDVCAMVAEWGRLGLFAGSRSIRSIVSYRA
jgi:hypothetical protein